MSITTGALESNIQKGWKPNSYLTDMSVAHFQANDDFVAHKIFPILPVPLSTSSYYVFNKGDLNRDSVQRKPSMGKVAPTVFGTSDQSYKCEVDQIIVGIDQIGTLDFQRARTPGISDPRKAKVEIVTNQMKIHQDIMFANAYFKSGVWTEEWTGVDADPTGKQSLKWNDANFDPVHFFAERRKDVKRNCLRNPNVLALGADAFDSLCQHPDIIERVKYTGSTANPAIVTANVLAQLFGIEQVVTFESLYNTAPLGAAPKLEYICGTGDALLAYVNPRPSIDQPSAGYTFAWDMLGDGKHVAVDQYLGEPGTHAEYIEGLMAYDMRKVCDDCAIFFSGMA